MLAEAGGFCFEDQRHTNGVVFEVRGFFKTKYRVFWNKVTGRMRRDYADKQFATENGAYGVAILIVIDQTGKTDIERSCKGTGFDFWIGEEKDRGGLPFQNKERVEISGILNGDESRIRARVKEKLAQVRRSDNTRLPALIVVVEFSRPVTHAERNERN